MPAANVCIDRRVSRRVSANCEVASPLAEIFNVCLCVNGCRSEKPFNFEDSLAHNKKKTFCEDYTGLFTHFSISETCVIKFINASCYTFCPFIRHIRSCCEVISVNLMNINDFSKWLCLLFFVCGTSLTNMGGNAINNSFSDFEKRKKLLVVQLRRYS